MVVYGNENNKIVPLLHVLYFGRDDTLSSLYFSIMHVPLKELTVCLHGRAYQRMFMKYNREKGVLK